MKRVARISVTKPRSMSSRGRGRKRKTVTDEEDHPGRNIN